MRCSATSCRRLQIALPETGTLDLAALFPGATAVRPRDRLWRRRASRAAGAGAIPTTGYIGAEVFSGGIAKLVQQIDAEGIANVRLFTDDALKLLVTLARRVARRGLSALSRPLAEDPPPQAPLRLADDAWRAGARPQARRHLPLRDRHRRLRRLDARPHRARAEIPLRGGRTGQLACALSRLAADALRTEGANRRPRDEFLLHLHPDLRSIPMRFIVYGVGAIGGTIAASLVLAGSEVVGIARGRMLDAIRDEWPPLPHAADRRARPLRVRRLTRRDRVPRRRRDPPHDEGAGYAGRRSRRSLRPASSGRRSSAPRTASPTSAPRCGYFPNVYGMTVMCPGTYTEPGEVLCHGKAQARHLRHRPLSFGLGRDGARDRRGAGEGRVQDRRSSTM